MKNDLKFAVIGIGSLPHDDAEKAFDDVEGYFSPIPFLPQLPKTNKFENMTFQCLENLVCLKKENGKLFLQKDLNEINKISDNIEDYAISYCSTMELFENYLKKFLPEYAKAQIIGPFTLGMVLKDENDKPVYFDNYLKEVIIIHLIYKGLWLANKIKKHKVKPIIFIDEPSVSMVGPYSDIDRNDVVDMLSKVVKKLKENDVIVGIHCCGKCDWSMLIDAGAEILSFDAFTYSMDFALYSERLKEFLNNGGKICWGIIPAMSEEVLNAFTLDGAYIGFYLALNYLIERGIDKTLLLNSSMLSTSCGMRNLSVELSHKAMSLTKDLSLKLKEIKI